MKVRMKDKFGKGSEVKERRKKERKGRMKEG